MKITTQQHFSENHLNFESPNFGYLFVPGLLRLIGMIPMRKLQIITMELMIRLKMYNISVRRVIK